jgi:two-component system, NarL family, invasion response regulator UvrY
MIRLIIADDHAVVRKGLKQIFDETPDIKVTNQAATGTELLEIVGKQDFDVVLLDISMPGRDGLDILRVLRSDKPDLPVLIFTMYPEEQYAMRVLKAGAAGYLNKESGPEELIDAIRKVAEHRKYISPYLAELLASNLETSSEAPKHDSLSDREFQVMCLIASGMTVTEIARKLSLSINTISTYRLRILDKLSMKSNAEITHYAIKNQLVG